MRNSTYRNVYTPRLCQHALLGCCKNSHPQAASGSKDCHLGSPLTLRLTPQPSLAQAHEEFPCSFYVLHQDSLNSSSSILLSPVFSRYLENTCNNPPSLQHASTECFIKDCPSSSDFEWKECTQVLVPATTGSQNVLKTLVLTGIFSRILFRKTFTGA